MTTLIGFIEKCKQLSFLQVFTVYLRYLIGGAFVIAAFGMGKFSSQELLISNPGASIETLEPLQQFFRVMATSGLYWQFIGLSQVIAGGLLMTQRFSKLGAVILRRCSIRRATGCVAAEGSDKRVSPYAESKFE